MEGGGRGSIHALKTMQSITLGKPLVNNCQNVKKHSTSDLMDMYYPVIHWLNHSSSHLLDEGVLTVILEQVKKTWMEMPQELFTWLMYPVGYWTIHKEIDHDMITDYNHTQLIYSTHQLQPIHLNQFNNNQFILTYLSLFHSKRSFLISGAYIPSHWFHNWWAVML